MVANGFANSETGIVYLQIDFQKPVFFARKHILSEFIIPISEFMIPKIYPESIFHGAMKKLDSKTTTET